MRTAGVVALVVLLAQSLHADAWPRGRGSAYIHLGISSIAAQTAFDPGGARVAFPGRGARRFRATLYAESGLTETLTLVVNAPYERVTSRGLFTDFTTAGGGDLDLRLRLSRSTGRRVFAIEGGAFFPLGYDDRAFPQLGTGTIDPVVNIAYGASVGAAFLSAQAGYRVRGGGISGELPYALKAGTFFHPRVGTFVAIRGWESRGDFRGLDPSFALRAADSEVLSGVAELYLRLTARLDANATWSRPLRGRNAAVGNEWSIGMARRW